MKETKREIWETIVRDCKSENSRIRKDAQTRAILELDGMIISIANQKYPSYVKKYGDELIQEGRIAVFINLKDFDLNRAAPTTFFYRLVLHAMHTYVQEKIMRVSRYYGDVLNEIQKTNVELCQIDGEEEHSVYDLHVKTGLPLSTITTALEMKENRTEISITTVTDKESFQNLPENVVEQKEIFQVLNTVMSNLPSNEKKALILYYGLFGEEKHSAGETAEILKITKEECLKLIRGGKYKLSKDGRLKGLV